jgi:transcriptional regulator with XRE-family HTH domain
MKTGERIRDLRIKKGLTQEELAEKTELSVRTIQRIENGEVDPRSFTLQMIAKALNVDFSIFNDTEFNNSDETQKEDEKTSLALLHLSGLFLLIFPTVLYWKKNSKSILKMKEHFYDIIQFQLSMWLLFIIPGISVLFIIQLPYLLLAGLTYSTFFTIFNTIRVQNDKPYKYLLTIRLLDNNGKVKVDFK